MGIGAFGRHRGEDRAPSNTPDPGQSGDGGRLAAFIDQGAEFEGTIHCKHTIRIDGEVRGEIISENSVIIAETAAVEATIRSKSVIINGAVSGDVIASRQILLRPTGRLRGKCETPSLSIESGALFNGKMKMVRPEVVARAKTAALKPTEPKERRPSNRPAELRARSLIQAP